MDKTKVTTIIFGLNHVLWTPNPKKSAMLAALRLDVPSFQPETLAKKLEFIRSRMSAVLSDQYVTKETITKQFLENIFYVNQTCHVSPEMAYSVLSDPAFQFCTVNPHALDVVMKLFVKFRLTAKSDDFYTVQYDRMRKNGFLPYFDQIICAENSYFKPCIQSIRPIIGDKDPDQFVMICGNLERDVKLANTAGITSIYINTFHTAINTIDQKLRPTYEVSSISDVLKILL